MTGIEEEDGPVVTRRKERGLGKEGRNEECKERVVGMDLCLKGVAIEMDTEEMEQVVDMVVKFETRE